MNDVQIESKWIAQIRDGDAQAFESLFRSYCSKLVRFSYRFVHDADTAENIVQDVFVNIWTHRASLDPQRNFRSYIYASVRNRALEDLRHQQVVQDAVADLKTLVPDVRTPEDEHHSRELAIAIQRAIDKLPERCRTIFVMSRTDRLTYREIAEVLDISVKTVETQMGRALQVLRKQLNDFL